MVMATQNPIEQEGTYPLPEAQLDRFLMQVNVDYPDYESEKEILVLARSEARQELAGKTPPQALLSTAAIHRGREEVLELYLAEPLQEYIVQLIIATRDPATCGEQMAGWIEYGASPRATIALDRCARARAWLNSRDFVTPEDIQAVIHDVLRHRLLLSFTAEAEGVDSDRVVEELLGKIPVP
jgi:MoxR-like ATPase